MKVALCICTCRRPVGLTRLLEAVAELDFEGQLFVIVVDNDAGREGLVVCERLATSYRWPLECVVEERRGISFARNRVVSVALHRGPDFIAIIDDDEWPCQQWLRELLRVQRETGADAVGGPVIPSFAASPADWMVRGAFFGTKPLPDLAPAKLNACNNFLIRARCLGPLLPEPFAVEFALSGGADGVFCRHLQERGCRMYWAARAHMFETIPESRMSLSWLRRRAFRHGNTTVRMQRIFVPGPLGEAVRTLKTVALLSLGSGLYVLAWPHQVVRIRAELMVAWALGKIAAHFGIYYLEYTEIHGA